MKAVVALAFIAASLPGQWIVNPSAATAGPALRAVLPDVQSVRTDRQFTYVESAGISLASLGALEAGGWQPVLGPRKFLYKIPLHPKPARDNTLTPLGVTGAFLNGVPIYSPVSPVSWHDQNLWHLDAVAARQRAAPRQTPVLKSLLLGYALDGFPVYGSNGFRSSYQLRKITRRSILPDGTELTPSQEGPPVTHDYPLGAFVEDYEYVPGSGDLDEHNGRLVNGTYAYYLATTPEGALQFPYLIGPTYYGELPGAAAPAPQSERIRFTSTASTLTFDIRDPKDRRIRFLEKVHEQPIHLLVVSDDLSDFSHIHPEVQPDDTWSVTHSFARPGHYFLYADLTPPGETQTIARFELNVKNAAPAQPHPSTTLTVKLTQPQVIRANEDITLRFDLNATDLEPYLGAWAHFMLLSADHENFIHAHPADDSATFAADANPWQHTHTVPGPSPSTITTTTGFRQPGTYKLWAQFKRNGEVETFPFTLQVLPALPAAHSPAKLPAGAIEINVSTGGFQPGRLTLSAGKTTTLAFRRHDAQSCASSVVFPELGIKKDLPVGQTVLIEIPAEPAGRELHFACGMKMYRGSLLMN